MNNLNRSHAVVISVLLLSAVTVAQPVLRLTLRQTAERVAANNPMVNAAHRDVEASEKQLRRAWREYVPTITANVQYRYLDNDIALRVNPITLPLVPGGLTVAIPRIPLLDRSTLRADISATVPLFTGLRIESGIRASRHLANDATAQDTLMLQKQVADALVSYNQVLLAEQNLRARNEAYTTTQKHSHDVLLLHEQGVATAYEKTRAQLAVADAERMRTEAENNLMLAQRGFKKALSLPDSIHVQLDDSLVTAERSVNLDDALLEANTARPELHSLAEKQEAVRAMSAAEFGKMLPQVGAFAKYELNDNALTQLDPKWIAGVSASVTIFNGLKDLASSQVYDIQERKLDELQIEAENSVALEVRKYFFDMKTAQKNIITMQTAMDLASEALRMANRRFETGMGTSLEVIDAQTNVVAMKTTHAAALYAYRSSYIQLVRALGRTNELLTGVF